MAEHIDTFTWEDAPEGTTHRDSLNQCFIQYDFDETYYYHHPEGMWIAYNPEEVTIKYLTPLILDDREE